MIKKFTTKEFISLLKFNKYLKIKGEYINNKTKILVETDYGDCLVYPRSLLNGNYPSIESALDKTEYFINKVKEIHGSAYGYGFITYINNRIKIDILCFKHGIFNIIPTNFLAGSGCKKCAFIKLANDRSSNKEEFINRANKIHNFKYDYSKFIYVNSITKGIIICPTHGEFLQTPISHLSESGCLKCGIIISANKQKISFNEFKLKADKKFNNKYLYLEDSWIDLNTTMKMICPKHGLSEQKPRNHMRHTTGCSRCTIYKYSNLKRRDFIEKYKHKICTFYVIRCYSEFEEFYKVGITSRNVKKRFHGSNKMPYNYEIMMEINGNIENIWDFESEIKVFFKKNKYKVQNKFNGSKFECFDINPIEFIEIFLNDFNLLYNWKLKDG